MKSLVRWRIQGVAPVDGLNGTVETSERDVVPLTAALRELQRRSGLEVVGVGPLPSGSRIRDSKRVYSVRLVGQGAEPTSCLLLVVPTSDDDRA
ncbi:MAG: hypothetical protein QM784_00595 [Polyangiaceae bacterium]